jgi:predicted dehydrogenase
MALNWGILGAGRIARDFILALKSLPQGENKVVAVGSSSVARAKEFAEENGIPKWYGSYEELTQDPAVQVVYVAGVTSRHAESSKLALNNGKHVLCEKAFAMNLREAKEVLDLAKEKKLFLMEV